MGFASIKARTRLPLWLLKILAYICELIGFLTGLKLKLSLFNVRMLTMHRWFDTSAAKRDLGYEPIISFDDGWHDTLLWFKEFWLPSFDAKSGVTGLAEGTQNKIDIQSAGTS